MMLIAHRGNMFGPDLENENKEEYITKALQFGFYVETDVWLDFEGKLMLGHDQPDYPTTLSFLLSSPNIIAHAKNAGALKVLLENGVHCFAHNKDDFVLTSRGIIWTYPNKPLTSISIDVNLAADEWYNDKGCLGVCSDWVACIQMKLCI